MKYQNIYKKKKRQKKERKQKQKEKKKKQKHRNKAETKGNKAAINMKKKKKHSENRKESKGKKNKTKEAFIFKDSFEYSEEWDLVAKFEGLELLEVFALLSTFPKQTPLYWVYFVECCHIIAYRKKKVFFFYERVSIL